MPTRHHITIKGTDADVSVIHQWCEQTAKGFVSVVVLESNEFTDYVSRNHGGYYRHELSGSQMTYLGAGMPELGERYDPKKVELQYEFMLKRDSTAFQKRFGGLYGTRTW